MTINQIPPDADLRAERERRADDALEEALAKAVIELSAKLGITITHAGVIMADRIGIVGKKFETEFGR